MIPQGIGLLLEPPLYVLGDRYPRKWFVVGGLSALAICDLLAGLVWSFWVLVGALALSGAASGCGVNLAQATLMDTAPAERERWMTRWTLMGSLRDLGTPLLFAALALLYVAWVFAPDVWSSAFLMAGVGACSAPLYPIAQAQAYRAPPVQSGMVNAVSSVFGPLTVVLPWALGLLADHLGLVVALLVLGLQPIGLFMLALREGD